ncbi:MAG TPA: TetR family transcriptional regulator [Mycobacterium sp.]|nr:TetR family transcriptional regulator [Mycobacterium sp.]
MARNSERTKAAILSAARERFAAVGYDAATIRAIAADAGIDPAMVMRYYGSKDQLFAAAAEFDLRFPDLSGVDESDVGKAVVTHFLNRWEDDEALVLLLRTSTTNSEAAQRMRQIFVGQLEPLVARLVPRDAAARAGLIATQILGLALCRYVLKLPPVAGMSREDVVAWIGPTLQRYLAGSVDC